MVESDYSVSMLIEDLTGVGIPIQKVEYEEDADAGMKYFEKTYKRLKKI